MRVRRASALLLALIACVVSAAPGRVPPVRGAEYTLESTALYDVRPESREIGVEVQLAFTNTTPDPEGRFSTFTELKLAIHDEATDVAASDADGELDVAVAVENEVNVATVELRDDLRFEEEVAVEISYTLPDGDAPHLRVRPSAVIFPAWSFGTAGEVSVAVPDGYELRVDGDPLTAEGDRLVSGPIDDPGAWLALVTAVRPSEYTSFDETVPLEGGTADLTVRAFSDDEEWGQRTLEVARAALPRLEDEMGLPYPRLGRLILTEVVTADSSGFAEGATGGTEIMVAFDQPPFTVIHQLSHVWLSPTLIEARWIREGLASHIAARMAEPLDAAPPYDPASVAEELAEVAFPLDQWSAGTGVEEETFGYAASWAFFDELEAEVGADALRTVLRRVAGSVGAYETDEVEPQANDAGAEPVVPLTTRTFLDHLENVSGAQLAERFAERVLADADIAMLGSRTEARRAFEDLARVSDGWGQPDAVRSALVAWSFDEARERIEEARAWIDQRDVLLAEMEAAGLAAPDRLREAYRNHGGGAEAVSELEAERSVVQAYAATSAEVNAERSFVERIGLIGGLDPRAQLNVAEGRFAEGDLLGAVEATTEAERLLAAAGTGGIVRLVSLAALVVILVAAAVILFRRRASYTPRP